MNSYQSAIQDCKTYFSQLSGLYDALLRGTGTEQENLTESWSDIDLTIIFDGITPNLLRDVNTIHKILSDKYSFKISITIVTKKDFFAPIHHHGIKPLYYNQILSEAISLFDKGLPSWNLSAEQLRFDCYANVAYLIHELRGSYLKLNLDDVKMAEKFALHLIKRTKHLIRNIIYIESGYIGEEINQEIFSKIFTHLDPDIPHIFEFYRQNWKSLQRNSFELNKIIDYMLFIAEQVYENNCNYRSNVNK